MGSSFKSTKSSSSRNNSKGKGTYDELNPCGCGFPSRIWTSHTSENPGSVFVDDAEAYAKYHREEEEPDNSINKGQNGTSIGGASTSTSLVAEGNSEGNFEIDEDDDDLDMDELNELEASLSKTSIQIQEP